MSAVRCCLNCGAVLTGRYCANCGQAADVHVPSTKELIHEALEGITHSDSRLWRTLYLLWFKPGELTQEFVAGRRAAYLPPFRLYLVLSILFFLTASVSNTHAKFVRFDNTGAVATDTSPTECAKMNATPFSVRLFGTDWAPRIKHACGEIARDNGANLLHVALGIAPKVMFIFLPLIALLHMLLYWRPRHRYAEHLLFFLHVHAFFFSVMTLTILSGDAAGAWPRLGPVCNLMPLLLWSLPLYTVLAMRRVFGGTWTRTVIKALALFAVYMVVMVIALTGVFVYAMLQL
ncbi:MAG TPA: DUF3667 domain-containing protein [Steroidobacteraceae bacterium]|nr:DUF3667 domain-containing protein [Steroidobacteraceae bacterium]